MMMMMMMMMIEMICAIVTLSSKAIEGTMFEGCFKVMLAVVMLQHAKAFDLEGWPLAERVLSVTVSHCVK